MQADFFSNFHQVAPPQTFAAFGAFPYGFSATPTSIPFHRNLERLKKVKPKHQSSNVGNSYEDPVAVNSTDESIHLVKTRTKTGESAPNRYDSETSLKKRSQSGHSLIVKGGSSAPVDEARRSHVRHQSEERSLSPSELNELRQSPLNHLSSETASAKGKSSKKRRERKLRKGTWHYADDGTAYSYADSRLIEQAYLSGQVAPMGVSYPYNMSQHAAYIQQQQQQQQQQVAAAYGQMSGYAQPTLGYPQYVASQELQYPDYASSAHVQYAMEQQQQQQYQPYQQYANVAQPGYDVAAPGGPLSAIDYSQYQVQQQVPQAPQPQQQQQQQPQYEATGYSQSYGYPAQVEQSSAAVLAPTTTTEYPVDYPSQSFGPVCEQQSYIPGLPPGAKIVAEYFLGYLDEPAQQQYAAEQTIQSQYANPCQQQYQYQHQHQQQQQQQHHHHIQQQQQQQQQPPLHSSSESSKEDVDIEVWENNKKIAKEKESVS